MKHYRLSSILLIAVASIAAVSCYRDESVTNPLSNRLARSSAPGSTAVLACATLSVALHGHSLDSVGVAPTAGGICGADLTIVIGGLPEYDGARGVVRIPLALHNAGTRALGSPARIYGWEDTLLVTSPPGLAHNKHSATYLEYVNADTVIGSTADALGGADVWRFDSLLGPAGTPEVLGPGSSSRIVWMEISVKQGVHAFTAELEATASASNGVASSIVVFADTGVAGPGWADTVAIAGDRVAYAFTPAMGFTNVQVRIDGQAAPVLGAIVADGNAHAITATADRILTVPSGAEGLYVAAEGVLTAGNVPAAYQAYLDSIYAYDLRVGDEEQATRDVSDVEDLVFDFPVRQVAIRRVDAALGGYSFRIGPDSLGDLSGPPIVNPGDTGIVIFSRTQQRVTVPPVFDAVPGDTIEPTVFLYVNGIFVNEVETKNTTGLLSNLVAGIPGFKSGKIITYYHYNRTWRDQTLTPEQQRSDCVMWFSQKLARSTVGMNSFPGYLAACMQDSTLRVLSDVDIIESVRQVFNILTNTQAPEVDAVELGNDIQHYRVAGRHVIVVPHSQGNLMTAQAIDFLSSHHQYPGTVESMCLGVVSLASPVDPSHFAVPEHQRAAIAVDGDLVPLTGGNVSIPRTSTSLSRRVTLRGALLSPVPEVAALYLTWQGFTTLHHANSSYLRTEAAAVVQRDMAQVYGACTVHDLEPIQPATIVQRGSRFNVNFNFFNSYGDLLRRPDTALMRTIADSTIVGPDGTGVFRALTNGTTSITAIYGGHSATTVVHVVDPIPPAIAGQWSGTWSSETDPAAFGTMQVTVSGNVFAMSATVTWTDQAGQVWHAFSTSYPTNIINDDPNLSSTARFWASYKKPTEPNGFDFFRFFILSNPRGSNQATGSASDGSGLDTWQISLTRVVNP